MIIVLKPEATDREVDHIVERIREWGMRPNVSRGTERTVIGILGDAREIRAKPLEAFPGVDRVLPVLKPYKLASAAFHAERTRVVLPPARDGDESVEIGGDRLVVMAGPCSVENRDMLMEIGTAVKRSGAHMLRGGAYKPRSSPYAFQGLGEEGLRYLVEVREATGLPVITEVMDPRLVDQVAASADVLQVGARNMQNYDLLKELGKIRKPVMIKRGLSSTIEELLMSAEYVLSQGNPHVLLCERGIRTYERATRNTLDLSAVPVLQRESHLPVVVDPSHGTGHWGLVAPMARAAVAAGADALMVEVHQDPENAASDGPQSLTPATFQAMMQELERVVAAIGRRL
jgi:3-deoxy-7-phosphoheptulonate synthase